MTVNSIIMAAAEEPESDPLALVSCSLNPSEIGQDTNVQDEIKKETLQKMDQYENTLHAVGDIPDFLHEVPLQCLRVETLDFLKLHLDPKEDIQASSNLCKDYRGVAEWAELDTIFIKYITKVDCNNRISEVISMWMKGENDGPKATVGSFRKCLEDIERPDVISDASVRIARDALSWKRAELEANTRHIPQKDTSWQLTRHDVVMGQKTYYTCCLIYADEDEGMANVITELYRKVRSNAQFFRPQFDLKHGAYELETTAEVIETRCNGKVIFLISEYFYASTVCRFAVNFCKHIDTASEQGNLIPFYLTSNYTHVPKVLVGIHGVKWYRRTARTQNWIMLTDTILGGNIESGEIGNIKDRMREIIENNEDKYLSDPPYEADTPLPGPPISVYDPAPDVVNSDDPSSRQFNPDESDQLVADGLTEEDGFPVRLPKSKKKKRRLLHFVRKKIFKRVT